MSKHTEGPWKITGGMSGTGGRLIGAHPGTGCSFDVARAELPPFGPDRDAAREANANLIAAAPDLLAICEETADALESNDPDLSLYWLAEQLRNAIAKARGEEE